MCAAQLLKPVQEFAETVWSKVHTTPAQQEAVNAWDEGAHLLESTADDAAKAAAKSPVVREPGFFPEARRLTNQILGKAKIGFVRPNTFRLPSPMTSILLVSPEQLYEYMHHLPEGSGGAD